MELCYANNPQSLFRKYAPLVTSLTKSQCFRDWLSDKTFKLPDATEKISLLLPNGFIEKRDNICKLTVTTRAVYAPKLYPALKVIDFFNKNRFYSTFSEMQKALLYELAQVKEFEKFPNPFGYQYNQMVNKLRFATLTFYPDAHPETTSVDGRIYRGTGARKEAFSTIRTSAGDTAIDNETASQLCNLESADTTNNYLYMLRGYFLFDTSSLGAGITITSSTFNVTGASTKNDAFTQGIALILCAPASNTALATGDYLNITYTRQATDVSIASYNITGLNTWTLNATGLSNIAKTGITKFATVTSGDMDNSAPSWSGSANSYANCNFADNGSAKPNLVVVYPDVVTTKKSYAFFM